MLKRYENYVKESKINEEKIFETTILNPNLSIVVPGGCNGKCDFCFWKKSTPCNNYLEKLNNILSNLPVQFYQLSLTGGEPTLSPHLESILNFIDKKVFKHTVLTSNGAKLIDYVSKLEGKIDHVNISRHHFDDMINDSIFKAKMLTKDELKLVSNELNKVGIDVTFSAVLNEHLNTKNEIENYLQFAKECGASQVFFRKPHGDLKPTEVEKAYESYKSSEYHCPVCRTKNQLIGGIKVSWKASLEEPSKELGGTIYELIVNENGDVTKDWKGKLKVDYNRINESLIRGIFECGGSSDGGGCGSDDSNSGFSEGCGSDDSNSGFSDGCGDGCGHSTVEGCGGSYGCGPSIYNEDGPYEVFLKSDLKKESPIAIAKITKKEYRKLSKNFKIKQRLKDEYIIVSIPDARKDEFLDELLFIRDVKKYNL